MNGLAGTLEIRAWKYSPRDFMCYSKHSYVCVLQSINAMHGAMRQAHEFAFKIEQRDKKRVGSPRTR